MNNHHWIRGEMCVECFYCEEPLTDKTRGTECMKADKAQEITTGIRQNGQWWDAVVEGKFVGRSIGKEVAIRIMTEVALTGSTTIESNV